MVFTLQISNLIMDLFHKLAQQIVLSIVKLQMDVSHFALSHLLNHVMLIFVIIVNSLALVVKHCILTIKKILEH